MAITKFTFDFDFFEFGQSNELWSFEIVANDIEALRSMIDEFEPEYEDQFYDMEEYGVHDFWGDDETLVGFSSYEINPDDKFTVLQKWREFFINHGCECGELIQE
ncbi:MAG: hypothetical protein R3220_09120 [Balneolaceae bacterium]|nr:hypothetical protein [Balneolaceae bacterium]